VHKIEPRPELLIVEDESYWIDHYRVALKNLPIDIHEAKSVNDANSLLDKHQFAALIVDLQMPGLKDSGMGGFEIIHRAHKRNRYTEKLVITAQTSPDVLSRVSKEGLRFITKNVDHRELSISVDAMIAAWKRRFEDIQTILNEFSTASLILQSRGHKKTRVQINDEYDIQDLLHFLYKPLFPDVVPEEYIPKRATRTKRVDLVIRGLETVIETKIARSVEHGRKIPDELDIDIRGYSTHPYCRRLICYVYDPKNHIVDPRAVETDLSGEQTQDGKQLDVSVMIRPA
jgi:CheY-like chemotaxis protein